MICGVENIAAAQVVCITKCEYVIPRARQLHDAPLPMGSSHITRRINKSKDGIRTREGTHSVPTSA